MRSRLFVLALLVTIELHVASSQSSDDPFTDPSLDPQSPADQPTAANPTPQPTGGNPTPQPTGGNPTPQPTGETPTPVPGTGSAVSVIDGEGSNDTATVPPGPSDTTDNGNVPFASFSVALTALLAAVVMPLLF